MSKNERKERWMGILNQDDDLMIWSYVYERFRKEEK